MFIPQQYAAETMFVYDWRDIALAILVALLFLVVGGVYIVAWISVTLDKLRARFKKNSAGA